jgi:hypothetical protein
LTGKAQIEKALGPENVNSPRSQSRIVLHFAGAEHG